MGETSVDSKELNKAIKAEKCPEAKSMLEQRYAAVDSTNKAIAADLEARIPVERVEDEPIYTD